MPARELSQRECLDRLYAHLGNLVAYWRDLGEGPLLTFKPGGDPTEERLTGLLFSLLSTLDGSSLAVPGFRLIPDIADEERRDAIEADEEYWPSEPINRGVEMHAVFPFESIPVPAKAADDNPAR